MKLKSIYTLLICFVAFASNGQLDRSIVPKAQPNPGINIPKPNVITLDNGLKVIIVENHKQPTLSIQLYVDHQPLMEGNKAGLSTMFGEMLGAGTETINKNEYDEQIDFMGASFQPNARGFFASSLVKHSSKLLSLLSSVVMQPAFPESEFDRIKNQTLSGLATTASDPSSMASNVAGVVNYGATHPYGEVVTEKTIKAITLDDVKNHYNSYFRPNNSYLVIVGDVQQITAKEYAEKYFGDWKKAEEPKHKYPALTSSKGDQVYFVDKPGAVQSVINITQTVNIKSGHEDEVKLRVLNAILGGGSFSARLMANLREDKAYTYGCYSRISSDEIIGNFYAGGSFRNEVTDSAIVQILFEINNIVDKEVKDSELDLVKKSMTGAFARSLENPQTVARFALNTIRYNLPDNYYATYLQKLEKVNKQDLLLVASEYLRPKNLNIIVVGNSDIAEKLTPFDSDGKITYKDAFGNDVTPLKAVADGVTAESIIDNFMNKTLVIDSKDEMNAKMKNIGFIQSTATAFIKEMGASLVLTTYKGTPNKSAMIMKAGGSVMQKEWFNGEKGGTFVMMQGKTEFTDEEIKDKQNNNSLFAQLNYFNDDSKVVELLGIANIDDVDYYKIKISNNEDDNFSYEYYNVKTGLLEMSESFSTDDEGNSNEVKMNYKDYKVYGKKKYTLLLPSGYVLETQGRKIEFETKSVTIKKKAKTTAFDGEFK